MNNIPIPKELTPNLSTIAISENVLKQDFLTERFKTASQLIDVGEVLLHQISPYLKGLVPYDATGRLLVAPQNLREIDDKGLGTWKDTIKRISEIKDYCGLDGMPIFNYPEEAPEISYEQALAIKIKEAWQKAQQTKDIVRTGFFLPTEPMARGYPLNLNKPTVENNLYTQRRQIVKNGGSTFITEGLSFFANNYYWTSTADPTNPTNGASKIDFQDGFKNCTCTNGDEINARPVVLQI